MGIKYQNSINPVIVDQEEVGLAQEKLLGKKIKQALTFVFSSHPSLLTAC